MRGLIGPISVYDVNVSFDLFGQSLPCPVLLYNPDENDEMPMTCTPAYIKHTCISKYSFCLFVFLKEFDTFLAFSAKNLGLSAFHKHIKRPEYDILIHSMPFCGRVSNPKPAKSKKDQSIHTLRSRSLSLDQFIHRKHHILLPRILHLHRISHSSCPEPIKSREKEHEPNLPIAQPIPLASSTKSTQPSCPLHQSTPLFSPRRHLPPA